MDLKSSNCCCEYCVARSGWFARWSFLLLAWRVPGWSYAFYFLIRGELERQRGSLVPLR